MGSSYSYFEYNGNRPSHIPAQGEAPSFDPNYGFSAPRKPRECKYSPEELKVLSVPEHRKNYCVDKVVEFEKCMRFYAPFAFFCKNEKHAIIECEVEDEILRMMEYEREKRLRLRQEKLQKQGVEVH